MFCRVIAFAMSVVSLTLPPVTFADSQQDYVFSITQAALHNAGSAATPLTTIEGAKVRMVAFTHYQGYKITDSTLGATIWTTVAPDLQQKCRQFVQNNPRISHQQLTLWLAEYLGVSPTQADTRQFVELEVPVMQAYYGAPASMIGIFRPCTDPRIGPHHDGSPICPAEMDSRDPNISSEYKTWFINLTIAAHTLNKNSAAQNTGAPWTEYGYTYNWNPKALSPYGITEFVVLKDTPVTVLANPLDATSAYVSPEQYCGVKN